MSQRKLFPRRSETKRALICGISGQDGSILAQALLAKGYEVFGSSRDAQVGNFGNLYRLNIRDRVTVVSMSLNDFRSVLQTIVQIDPDEIYNLAGQSSVALSFDQPVETMESIGLAALNFLEALRFLGRPIRFYNAGSSESFGETPVGGASESDPFRPRSPYAVAKATAFWEVANYREAYGLYACSGLLFNHESILRPERFVTRKVVATAVRIAKGSNEKLLLGNLHVQRDWGWAEEYVEAMWRILQQEKADDFVIATGESNSLESFVEQAFSLLSLDWHDHVIFDKNFVRPSEIVHGCGNPAKAKELLNWQADCHMAEVVQRMIKQELISVGDQQK